MRVLLARFVREDSGATAIGYALIAAGMSVAIIAALSGLGAKLSIPPPTVRAAVEWPRPRAAVRLHGSCKSDLSQGSNFAGVEGCRCFDGDRGGSVRARRAIDVRT